MIFESNTKQAEQNASSLSIPLIKTRLTKFSAPLGLSPWSSHRSLLDVHCLCSVRLHSGLHLRLQRKLQSYLYHKCMFSTQTRINL